MSSSRYGANTIVVQGETFLLAEVGGGEVVHVVRPQDQPGSGRGAVHDFYFDCTDERYLATRQNYDRDELLQARWSRSTLCGHTWAAMAGGDGGPLDDDDEVAFAPTCKRCLSLIDRLFPAPPVDDRLGQVAQLAADIVADRGCAEVRDVPGDQQAALRKAIRELVRKRTGYATNTFVRSTTIHVICDEAHRLRSHEYDREAASAIGQALAGKETQPARTPEWVIFWETWGVS